MEVAVEHILGEKKTRLMALSGYILAKTGSVAEFEAVQAAVQQHFSPDGGAKPHGTNAGTKWRTC